METITFKLKTKAEVDALKSFAKLTKLNFSTEKVKSVKSKTVKGTLKGMALVTPIVKVVAPPKRSSLAVNTEIKPRSKAQIRSSLKSSLLEAKEYKKTR